MHTLKDIKPLADYKLECRFSNGISKQVDLKPYLHKEAFLALIDAGNFYKVVNNNYFIEWLGLDIDMSADTLWHIGV
jgi:Protein of unknown function (DUF2442)